MTEELQWQAGDSELLDDESVEREREEREQQTRREQAGPRTISGQRWVPDVEVSDCASCGATFSFFKRKHHCRRCGYVFCAQCSTHRVCFQYQAKEVTDSDDDGDEDEALDAYGSNLNSEPVYGAPQRVCDSCFFCCILAPMIAWAHGHPVDGFVPSSEIDEAIATIRGITSVEGVADALKAPATADETDAQQYEQLDEVPLPHTQVLMGWARVLLVLDKGLASLRQEAVVSSGAVKESLFWWRYFRRVYMELNDEFEDWDDDSEDYEDEDDEDYIGDEIGDGGGGMGRAGLLAMVRADIELAQRARQRMRMQHQGSQQRPQAQLAPPAVRQALSEQNLARFQELVSEPAHANAIFDPQKGFTLLHIAVLQVRPSRPWSTRATTCTRNSRACGPPAF
eukprot:SAG11_NODE_3404_length_2466_cov_4.031686_1_plen_397_part_00